MFGLKTFHIFLLIILFFFGSARRRSVRRFRTPKYFKGHLDRIKSSIDDALDKYIISYMNCSSLKECRMATTDLKIGYLPTFIHVSKNTQELQNWNHAFTENLIGLYKFNFYLEEFIKTSQEKTLSFITESHLRDVSYSLSQFIIHFKVQMEINECFNLGGDLFEHLPSCSTCVHPHLPSQALEVVRNYQFLMQFYDFLNEFSSLYKKFISLHGSAC